MRQTVEPDGGAVEGGEVEVAHGVHILSERYGCGPSARDRPCLAASVPRSATDGADMVGAPRAFKSPAAREAGRTGSLRRRAGGLPGAGSGREGDRKSTR